ncbi:MAG: NADH-quinone oxidoreductase subunit C [Chloroflexi bacterium]|nr:NADH-quinone oxidoreductase subunit C [Chloroflexota bacterium]
MTDFTQLRSVLAENFQDRITNVRILRENELHFQIARGDALNLTKILHAKFNAELRLMVANDRRADKGSFEIHYLFVNDRENWYAHATKNLSQVDPTIDSMATFYYPASRFEREIHDLFGIEAIDHPDTRPLVRHAFWPKDYFPLRKDSVPPEKFEDDGTPFEFMPIGGEGVYEIPVGPVHAGIIEPGHFRFSVVGETVIDLKIRLYFTHKGTEKLFEGRAPIDGVELAERISGDTTIGHSLAYCQAIESLAHCEVPARATYLRVILLEMERLYNHIADFGAICNDTGFAAAHSHCFRIRERLLRLNKRLTGNRILHGGIVPGGVAHDLPADLNLAAELDAIIADFNEIVEISLNNTLLADRLDGAGYLTTKTAADHGVLGYVARASGIDMDARRDHPFAAYPFIQFKVAESQSGDVRARAQMRVDEARESVSIIKQALGQMPVGVLAVPLGKLPAWEPAFGMVEGWRGAILHWVMADENGNLFRVKIKDPSFVNWPALSFALLKNIVPDFPLCNKSFNQSYSGNDL